MTISDEPQASSSKRLPNPQEWLTVEELLDPTLDPEAPPDKRRQLTSEREPTVGEGFRAAFHDVSPADFIGFADSVKEVGKANELSQAAEDYELGIATPEQLGVLMQHFGNQADQFDGWAKVANVGSGVVRDMPAFMQEMWATGGVGAVARRAFARGAVQAALKTAEETAKRSVFQMLKKGAILGAETAVLETAIATPFGGGRLQANVLERLLPGMGMTPDEAGKLALALEASKPDLLSVLPSAIVDTLIEPISERSGAALMKLPLMEKLGALQMAFVKRMMGQGYSVDTITRRLMEKGAWHGIIGENAEDVYGDLLRVAASYVTPGNTDQLRGSLSKDWEEWAGQILGISATGGAGFVSELGELYIGRRMDRDARAAGIPDWARDAKPEGDDVFAVQRYGGGERPQPGATIEVPTDDGPQKVEVVGVSTLDRTKEQVEAGEGPEHEEVLWVRPVKAKPEAVEEAPAPEAPRRPAGAENDPLAGQRAGIPADPLTEKERAFRVAQFGAANDRPTAEEVIPNPEQQAIADFWGDRGVDLIFVDAGEQPKVLASNPRQGVFVVAAQAQLEGPESLPRLLGHEFIHELAKTDLSAFERLERLVLRFGGKEYLDENRKNARRDMQEAGLAPEAATDQRLREEALAYRAQDLWNTVLALSHDGKVEALRELIRSDRSLFQRVAGWARQLLAFIGIRLEDPIFRKLRELGVDLAEVTAPPGISDLERRGAEVTIRDRSRKAALRAKQNTLQAAAVTDMLDVLADRMTPSAVAAAEAAGVPLAEAPSVPPGAKPGPEQYAEEFAAEKKRREGSKKPPQDGEAETAEEEREGAADADWADRDTSEAGPPDGEAKKPKKGKLIPVRGPNGEVIWTTQPVPDGEAETAEEEREGAADAGWADRDTSEAGQPDSGAGAIIGFTTEMGSTYVVDASGRTARTKAPRDTPGHEGDFGQKPLSDRTIYLDTDAAAFSVAGTTGLSRENYRLVVDDAAGLVRMEMSNDARRAAGLAPKVTAEAPFTTEPAVGRYPLELWGDEGSAGWASMHAGNRITEVTYAEPVRPDSEAEQPAPPKLTKGELREASIEALARRLHGRRDWETFDAVSAELKELSDAGELPPEAPPWFNGLSDRGKAQVIQEVINRVEGRDVKADREAREAQQLKIEQERERRALEDTVNVISGALRRGEDLPNMRAVIALLGGRGEIYKRVWMRLTRKQQEERVELAVVMTARKIVKELRDSPPQRVFEALVSLYRGHPKFATRTSSSAARQAYSTPVPLAYIASRLGWMAEGARVLEPTAGTGMLLMEVDPAVARVNELDPERADALRAQGFHPTQLDATEMELPQGLYDRVIANPPFGKIADEAGKWRRWKIHGARFTNIDPVIALRSLDAMAADGRAVLIVGGKMNLTKKDDTPQDERMKLYRERNSYNFLDTLHKRFNVVKHVQVSGSLYERQGASWPVDVIVIDGKNPTGKYRDDLPAPAFISPPAVLRTWEEVGGLLDEADRLVAPALAPGSGGGTGPGAEGRGGDVEAVSGPSGASGGSHGGSGGGGTVRGPAPSAPAPGPDDGGAQEDVELVDDAPGDGDGLDSSEQGSLEPLAPESDGDAERAPDRPDGPGLADVPRDVRANEPAEHLDERTFQEGDQAKYPPVSRSESVDTLVPANLIGPTLEALHNLRDRVGDVDEFVARRLGMTGDFMLKSRRYSGEQVDALGLAMVQVDSGKGFIIGDQTGVGKGRFVGGMIQYAHRKGLVPVFVTQSPGLYADMVRDLYATGFLDYIREKEGPDADLRIFVTNTTNMTQRDPDTGESYAIPLPPKPGETESAGELRPNSKKEHEEFAEHIKEHGRPPAKYHVIMTTYSQLDPRQGRFWPRHDLLRAIAPNSFLLLDESHEAGGDPAKSVKRGGDKNDPADWKPTRAGYVRELVRDAQSVVYSSATWAKNLVAFGVYSRTDLGDLGDRLAATTTADDVVPVQQAVSRALARAGQMIRREKSFEGIEMAPLEVDVDLTLADEMTSGLRAIFEFDKLIEHDRDQIAGTMLGTGRPGSDSAIGSGSVTSVAFSSIMHNVVGQMLAAIKARGTAMEAIRAIDAGQKPIVTISQTFGKLLEDFTSSRGVAVGDEFGMSFKQVFLNYLDRTTRITLTSAQDETTHVDITDRLSPEQQEAKEAVRAQINALEIADLPASPIDYIKHLIGQHKKKGGKPARIEEITGRTLQAEYVAPERWRLIARKTGPGSKKRAMNGFNSGSVDALIINRAGATGFSLHASRDFKDKRPRRMLVLEPEPDVNQFMQILGRVNRTGQVVLPSYGFVSTPIPAEKRAVAGIMMRLAGLNANTSAGRKGSMEVRALDVFNSYGNEVAKELLEDRPEDAAVLFPGGLPATELARKLTGTLAILPIADQQSILDDLITRYDERVAQADAEGNNILRAARRKVLHGPEARVEMDPARGEGAFSDTVYAESYVIEKPRAPLSLEDIKAESAEAAVAYRTGGVDELEERRSRLVEHVRRQGAALLAATDALRDESVPEKRDRLEKQAGDARNAIEAAQSLMRSLDALHDIMASVLPQRGLAAYTARTEVPQVGQYGALVGLRVKPVKKNPVVPSAIQVRVRNFETGRTAWVTLTKLAPALVNGRELRLNQIGFLQERGVAKILDERNAKKPEETRWFLTNNVVGALGVAGVANSDGVTLLEMPDGSVRESVLTAAGWNPGRAIEDMPVVVDEAAVLPLLRHGRATQQGIVLASADGTIMLSTYSGKGQGEYRLAVQSRGNRRIITAPSMIEAVGGEGLVRGSTGDYSALLDSDRADAVVRVLGRTFGVRFVVREGKGVAREFLETFEPDTTTHAVRRSKRVFDRFDLPPERPMQYLRRRFIRFMQRLHQYQLGVLEEGGIITDETDVVNRERLMHGRTRELLRELFHRYEEPIVRLMAKGGLSQTAVDTYLYARHAPSRNAVIAERQRKKLERSGVDPEEIDDLINEAGSGMTNERAAEIIAAMEAGEVMDEEGKITPDPKRAAAIREIGRLVDEMNLEALSRSEQYGLITNDQFDEFVTQWDHYVPLRTTMESRAEGLIGLGREFGAKGAEYRRAEGRTSLADSPLAYSIQQAQRTIMRGEQNRVGVSFLRLLRANKAFIRFAESVKELRQDDEHGEPGGVVEWSETLPENVLTVKVDGKEVEITIADKLVVRAMKRLGNSGVPDGLRFAHFLMRKYAMLVTQLDPDFLIRNAMRDYGQALFHLDADFPGVVGEAASWGNWIAAFKGLSWYYKNPADAPTTEWQKYARELARAGGLPGYFGLETLESRIAQINAEVERLANEGKAKEALRKMIEAAGVTSQSIEGAMRLVAFRALRRRGISREKAAGYVKDLTVNFDQKGEFGVFLNSIFLFWNASVQGLYRSIGGLARNKRMRRVAAGVIVLGFVNGFVQRLVGGDDDDGIPFYDKRPSYEKDTKIIFMIPGTGRAITFPMPYVYNVLYRLGDHLAALVQGAQTPSQALAAQWELALHTVNPWGQESTIAQLLMPTLADPALNVYMNKQWHGGVIYPDWGTRFTPDSELVFDRNRGDLLHRMTRWLSEMTGGDETKGGSVLFIDTDWSPETLRYLIEFYTGGVGKFLSRSFSAARTAVKDGVGEVDGGNVPLLRTIYSGTEQSWKTEERNFYRWTDEIAEVKVKLKRADERNSAARYAEIEREYETKIMLTEDAAAARSRVKDLRSSAIEAQDERDRREYLDMLREEVRAFNALAYRAGLR